MLEKWKHRGRRASHGRTVVFLGVSEALSEAHAAVEARGFHPVEIPHPALVCAVADPAVLAGRCTSAEAAALRRVKTLGLPCLTPDQALTWLAELDRRVQLTSA
jgi:hypothetical protein